MSACTSSCVGAAPAAGRATVSFDFPHARNVDHADVWILAVPTSWIDPVLLRLDHVGYAISTHDKPKLCKPYYCWEEISDNFVTMTTSDDANNEHPDTTDTLRLNFQSGIVTQDAYPGDWTCWNDFGCDNMFVSMGVPKGAPSGTAAGECGTYSKLQDVVQRKQTTTASPVLTWQRGSAEVRTMQQAMTFPASYWATASVSVDSSGFPALLTSQAYEWWNTTFTGAAVVTQSVLAKAAREDPGLGRMSARMAPSGCTSSSPTNYPSFSSCPAAEPAGSVTPTIPYSATPPSNCHPYTIEPRTGTKFQSGSIWAAHAIVAFPTVYCWYILVSEIGAPYWGPFLQRTMQKPGC